MAKHTNDPVTRFFDDLAKRAHEPLLRKATGSFRFDVVDGRKTRRFVVHVEKGDLSVTKGGGDASCILRADKGVFDRIMSGRMNAVAAVLRGDVEVAGDWRLLVRLQRLFPGPRRPRVRA